ncbi:D-amino acid dehydrogenase [Ramlibacter sp. H39-3-26]|uniref:D-amino acid dehydrogenase n=1 Tax=Curvibacter soli TaxID=3031331 RepID=UPI0023D99730|nr:D-amino acid dehydrogenase [Ramlibacter sp. H39-3-26]MDF1485561.1 D-amino acid dehydrogenase [Ramlibacter sp. H39-3-26]
MQVVVLGAGIVGLAAAYELQRQGHAVTVVDRAASGAGASSGNGAQLSYSYVQPLADPSIWGQLPKLLFAADSPLKLRPRLDPLQWRWVLQFMAACNAATSHAGTATLLALAAASRAGFEAMRADVQPDCDFSATGKLVLYRGAKALAGARRQMALQRGLGSEQRIVSPAECAQIEPALREASAQIAGAVYTPSECAADCLKVCRELERVLRARSARFVLGAEVTRLEVRGGMLVAARTTQGPVEADAFVLALGTASHPLGRQVGQYLPVYPLKGYSLTLDVTAAPDAAPRVSVTDAARKVVFARIGERLRVAGIVELVGGDTAIAPARIASLRDATRAVFPHCAGLDGDVHPWTGMRPATPTGLPIAGRLPGAPANLLFDTGHGALGFTLAFGTARQVAQALGAAG